MLNTAILQMVIALSPADALCLQKNAYFEARNQSDAGMVAVTHVVLNRVASDRFPDTVCEVVEQGHMSKWWKDNHDRDVPVRHKCQFSWFCDGLSDEPKEKEAWKHAQRVALEAYALGMLALITAMAVFGIMLKMFVLFGEKISAMLQRLTIIFFTHQNSKKG